MPIWISFIAIVGIAFIAGRLFNARTALTDKRVYTNFERVFPDQRITDIFYTTDKYAAIVLFDDNSVGYALVLGDRVVVKAPCTGLSIPATNQVKIPTQSFGDASYIFNFEQADITLLREKGMISAS